VGKYRQAARGDELIEPVVHQAEEAPLSDLSRRKLLRLFGRRLRIFLHRSLIKDLPATRFQPIALRLPSRLSKRWQQVPDKIKRVLKRSHRPLVLDFSQLIVTDPRFWVKIHEAVKPFGRRVRLLVRAGTGALFSKLGLKNLRKLTIGGG
jgi:hypothetical protein